MQEITIIKPETSRFQIGLKDLWIYRELLYFMTLRDLKIRYKQTAIGVFWAILQPVLTTAIFTAIFTSIARFESITVPYPLFALSGILIWLYVNTSITMASNSLVGNANLVTKIYFPRLIVPLAATLSGLLDLLIGVFLLVLLMLWYGAAFSAQMLLAPVFIGLGVILATAIGTFFAAVNVKFRDVKFALPFALQIWMFLSPVFYPLEILSEKWRLVFAFNPLTGILLGFRSSMFGTPYDWFAIGISAGFTLILLMFGFFVFKKMENDFADLI